MFSGILVNHTACEEKTSGIIAGYLVYSYTSTGAGVYEFNFTGFRIRGYAYSHMAYISSATGTCKENKVSFSYFLTVYLRTLRRLHSRAGTEADAELFE